VRRLLDLTPGGGQRVLFSATLDVTVGTLVDGYLTDRPCTAVSSGQAASTR